MCNIRKNRPQFLGRDYDERTDTWSYTDGSSGVYTERDRQDVFNAVDSRPQNVSIVLGKLAELRNNKGK